MKVKDILIITGKILFGNLKQSILPFMYAMAIVLTFIMMTNKMAGLWLLWFSFAYIFNLFLATIIALNATHHYTDKIKSLFVKKAK